MSKGTLYTLPRTALRHEKPEYARAVELFQSKGEYVGDPVLVAFVVTYCYDHRISFRWDTIGPGETSRVTRIKG